VIVRLTEHPCTRHFRYVGHAETLLHSKQGSRFGLQRLEFEHSRARLVREDGDDARTGAEGRYDRRMAGSAAIEGKPAIGASIQDGCG
jgi:hypothetical protein